MLSEVRESDDSFEKYWMNWKNWNRIFQMQYWMEVRRLNKWKRSYSPFGMKKNYQADKKRGRGRQIILYRSMGTANGTYLSKQ